MMYKDKKTKLYRKRFSMERLKTKKVSLWNIAPDWPGISTSKSKVDAGYLAILMKESFLRSADHAHLILWMPASELHRTPFDPVTECGDWTPIATIISGSDPIHIGYVYVNSQSWIDWTTQFIHDARGKRGCSSSKTVKFVIEEFGDDRGPIVDVFAHSSALLPVWARRAGHRYIGYTSSKKAYIKIASSLAQVELPDIQLEMPI